MTDPHGDHELARQLWDLATGVRHPEIERHVAGCATCQTELDTLRQLAHAHETTGESLAEPPPHLRASLINLFGKVRPDLTSARQHPADQMREAMRRIFAELIFDSGEVSQLAGLRSGGARSSRQLAFTSDVADLDIEIAAHDTGATLHGQLGMDEVPAELVITFTDADHSPVSALVDPEGHFTATLPAGDWTATVRIDDVRLVFPSIRL